MGRIMVTGGAGYVGSHIVRLLADEGEDLLVVDDLSQGHAAAIGGVPMVRADFADGAMLDQQLAGGGIEFIIHMAASCEVGESIDAPAAYYTNNVTRTLEMMDAARSHGVKGIVFSSTAAVYGEPGRLPIEEAHPKEPTNPYGDTKLAIERALGWYAAAYGMRFVALRYFNAAGAHPDGAIGEDHDPESHLIPRLLKSLQSGEEIPIFGEDYPTDDGTCIRDYIHVVDLAQAHILALKALRRGEVEAEAFNLGNGEGFSVREVIEVIEKVTGKRPPTLSAPRRAGDPAILVASSKRICERLGWQPSHPTLEEIVGTAWEWHRNHPRGYDDGSG
jgi:UDP-glucose-4-epimerase GalE